MGKNSKVAHYRIRIGEIELAYLYIRKNACSAWKRLFIQESPARARRPEYDSAMAFMQREHRVRSVRELARVPNRVVVLRDPIERVVSGFTNQLIMRLGERSKPIGNVETKCGKRVGELTFAEFVNEYILATRDHEINPHFLRQSAHLAPVEYTHMWLLDDLETSAARLLGAELSEKYFGRPRNATASYPRYN